MTNSKSFWSEECSNSNQKTQKSCWVFWNYPPILMSLQRYELWSCRKFWSCAPQSSRWCFNFKYLGTLTAEQLNLQGNKKKQWANYVADHWVLVGVDVRVANEGPQLHEGPVGEEVRRGGHRVVVQQRQTTAGLLRLVRRGKGRGKERREQSRAGVRWDLGRVCLGATDRRPLVAGGLGNC